MRMQFDDAVDISKLREDISFNWPATEPGQVWRKLCDFEFLEVVTGSPVELINTIEELAGISKVSKFNKSKRAMDYVLIGKMVTPDPNLSSSSSNACSAKRVCLHVSNYSIDFGKDDNRGLWVQEILSDKIKGSKGAKEKKVYYYKLERPKESYVRYFLEDSRRVSYYLQVLDFVVDNNFFEGDPLDVHASIHHMDMNFSADFMAKHADFLYRNLSILIPKTSQFMKSLLNLHKKKPYRPTRNPQFLELGAGTSLQKMTYSHELLEIENFDDLLFDDSSILIDAEHEVSACSVTANCKVHYSDKVTSLPSFSRHNKSDVCEEKNESNYFETFSDLIDEDGIMSYKKKNSCKGASSIHSIPSIFQVDSPEARSSISFGNLSRKEDSDDDDTEDISSGSESEEEKFTATGSKRYRVVESDDESDDILSSFTTINDSNSLIKESKPVATLLKDAGEISVGKAGIEKHNQGTPEVTNVDEYANIKILKKVLPPKVFLVVDSNMTTQSAQNCKNLPSSKVSKINSSSESNSSKILGKVLSLPLLNKKPKTSAFRESISVNKVNSRAVDQRITPRSPTKSDSQLTSAFIDYRSWCVEYKKLPGKKLLSDYELKREYDNELRKFKQMQKEQAKKNSIQEPKEESCVKLDSICIFPENLSIVRKKVHWKDHDKTGGSDNRGVLESVLEYECQTVLSNELNYPIEMDYETKDHDEERDDEVFFKEFDVTRVRDSEQSSHNVKCISVKAKQKSKRLFESRDVYEAKYKRKQQKKILCRNGKSCKFGSKCWYSHDLQHSV